MYGDERVTDQEILVGSTSSRRLRREQLEEIEVRQARWKLRFYCWGGMVCLLVASAQAVEIVVALLEHRVPHILLDVRQP